MNKKNYIMFRAYGAEQTLCLNPVKSITPDKKTSQKLASSYSFLKTLLFVAFCFSALLAYSAYADDDVLYPSDENNGWEIIEYDDSNMVTLTRTGNIEASHVLKAMGFSVNHARESFRISFSPILTLEEVIQAAELIALGVNKLKSL